MTTSQTIILTSLIVLAPVYYCYNSQPALLSKETQITRETENRLEIIQGLKEKLLIRDKLIASQKTIIRC